MKRSTKSTGILFAVLLVCWLPYMVMCFPGNIAYDTGTGISWYLNLDRSNPNNPWFQNLLMGFFYSLGSDENKNLLGIALYCILQTVLTAFLLSRFLVLIREKTRLKKLIYPVLAIYALIPAFPLYAFTMAKDSNFALAILFFEYLAAQALLEPEAFRASRIKVWLLCAIVILMGLLRNHAGWIPATVFLILALKHKKRRAAATAGAAFAGILFFSAVLPAWLGIPSAETKENLSMPLQTTAYYLRVHPDEITEDEAQVLHAVMPEEAWQSYQEDTADPLKAAATLDAETTGPFLRTWLGLWGKHPLTLLKGWYRSTYGYLLPWIQTTVKDHAIVGNRMRIDVLRTLRLNMWGNALEINARNADEFSLTIPGIHLFAKIGLYSWLLIALTATVIISGKKPFWLCLAPLLMVFIGCLLSPVNGYYRYAFPFILSLPPVFLLVFGGLKADRIHKGQTGQNEQK